jgi:hypothetical protein
MSNNTHTFDINRFVFTFGTVVASGFAPGTFVTIDFVAPLFVETQGTDGEVCRVLRNKYMAKINLSLMQSSHVNDMLTAILAADVAGNIPVPLFITDNLGTYKGTATQCWISKQPKVEFGDETKTREWEITAASYIANVGGSI